MLVQLIETNQRLLKLWNDEWKDSQYLYLAFAINNINIIELHPQSARWWAQTGNSWKQSLEIKSIYDIRYDWVHDKKCLTPRDEH